MSRISHLLYPKISLRQGLGMLVFGLAGALIAGLYGILHDQITYSLGPEYFTCFKFQQFHYLDFDKPARFVVAEIGFLATCWVGFFAGWFMGRVTLPHLPAAHAAALSLRGAGIMLASALIAGLAGWMLAPSDADHARLEHWRGMLAMFHITDEAAFVRVGWIHNAGYLGALAGLVAALLWLRKQRGRA